MIQFRNALESILILFSRWRTEVQNKKLEDKFVKILKENFMTFEEDINIII